MHFTKKELARLIEWHERLEVYNCDAMEEFLFPIDRDIAKRIRAELRDRMSRESHVKRYNMLRHHATKRSRPTKEV